MRSFYMSRTIFAFAATVCMAGTAPSAEQFPNETLDSQYIWDLTEFFATPEAWASELAALRETVDSLDAEKSTLGTNAAILQRALNRHSVFQKRLDLLWTYASNRLNENLGNAEAQDLMGQVRALSQDARVKMAYLGPELIALGEETVEHYLTEEPGLEKHTFSIRNRMRKAPHTLGPEAERVLSLSAQLRDAPESARSLLANVEVDWPTIILSDGTDATLTAAGYSKHRQARNRDDRLAVFDAFWAEWKKYESTLGATLNGEVQGNLFVAKARKYNNALEFFLSADNIPPDVYRTLVEVTNKNLPTLHRYFQMRADMLGVSDLGYHDIYPSMIELDRKFTIEDARALTVEAVAPLGARYVSDLTNAAGQRWMHVYPQPGKRSGAYMSGAAYDIHPLILLNHQDTFDSVSTYAHEWGHAIHSVITNRNQPFETSDYSIFIAEIAAIVNELLLQDHMLRNAKTDAERMYYLGYGLEQIRGTYYRQTMFAEFELAMHEAAERGEAVTGAKLTKIYGDIQRAYHGHDQGVMTVDDSVTLEWAYVPHFFYNFYVYQYATSIAAAAYFVDQIQKGGPAALETYLDVLRAGGSDYPYQILLDAGLDMATPEPYEAIIKRMDRIMNQMQLINDRG